MSTIHNPVNFNPADYEVQDYLDNKRPPYYGQDLEHHKQEVLWWEKSMAATLGPDWRAKMHHCIHCGNGSVRWITATKHIPTGEVVVFGAICTARLGFADKHAFKLAQLQAKAEAGHARMKVWKQREEFVATHPEVATALEQAKQPVHAKNTFVQDVLGKLNQYGSLSDRQVAAVVQSLARDLERVARQAVEVTEVKGDAPSGRTTVTGLVLTIKQQASSFAPGGFVTKMLVKLANNAKVWLTVPSKATIVRGDTVTVTATFEVSKDDKHFAFGSRPFLVSRVPATQEAV